MITTSVVALWLVALTFVPQETQSCNGDCQGGYRSVCVQRGTNCKCTCIKDVEAGIKALRDLLSDYNASDPATINDAEERYKEFASQETGEFSFTIYESHVGYLTIRGQGFGTSADHVCCLALHQKAPGAGGSSKIKLSALGQHRFVY